MRLFLYARYLSWLFMAPLAVLSSYFIHEQYQLISSISKEQKGQQAINRILELMHDSQNHRLFSTGLNTPDSLSDARKEKEKIKSHLEFLDARSVMHFDEWKKIRDAYPVIILPHDKWSSWEEQTDLILRLIELIQLISYRSNLLLDSDPKCLYLITVLYQSNAFPYLTERLSQIRLLGFRIVSKKPMSLSERQRFIFLTMDQADHTRRMQNDLKQAISADGETAVLMEAFLQFETRQQDLLNYTDKINRNEAVQLTEEEYLALATGPLEQAYRFQQAASREIERRFESRIRNSGFNIIAVTSVTVLILMMGLALAFRQKRNQDALLESEAFNRQIIDGAQDGIVVVDSLLRFIVWNPVMEALSGKKAEDVLGRRLEEAFPYQAQSGITELRMNALKGNHFPRFVFEIPAEYSVSGRTVVCESSYSPLFDRTGRINGVISVVRDITESRKIQHKLMEVQRLDSIGGLAAGIAHDFNNMLSGIMGYASILLRLVQDENQKKMINSIISSTTRASGLTEQLVTYSRQKKATSGPVNLNSVILETMEMVRTMALERIEFKLDLQGSLKSVEGDKTQIQQVVMNVCMNAVEAIEQSGTLTIHTANYEPDSDFLGRHPELRTGPYALLEVSDTGRGMDEATQARIFEPFFSTKIENPTKKGTGLGLAVTWGIIRSHRGVLEVESSPGVGTVMRIYFPASVENAPEADKTTISSENFTSSGIVLLVDDEEVLLDVGTRMLKAMGFEVLTAKNGALAVELFREENKKIRAVILDLRMPVMGGVEALKKMKEIDPDVRVIVSSGYGQAGEMEEAMKLGACSRCDKPFTIGQMENCIISALENRNEDSKVH